LLLHEYHECHSSLQDFTYPGSNIVAKFNHKCHPIFTAHCLLPFASPEHKSRSGVLGSTCICADDGVAEPCRHTGHSQASQAAHQSGLRHSCCVWLDATLMVEVETPAIQGTGAHQGTAVPCPAGHLTAEHNPINAYSKCRAAPPFTPH
jgi:hypothetical protein